MSDISSLGNNPSVSPITQQSRAADNVRAQERTRASTDSSFSASLDPNQVIASLQSLQPSQVVNDVSSVQQSSDRGEGLLTQLRRQIATSTQVDHTIPPDRQPQSVDRQVVPVQNHPRPAQSGYVHNNNAAVSQYASIYNSTALSIDRMSIAPMATERPQVSEVRVQQVR